MPKVGAGLETGQVLLSKVFHFPFLPVHLGMSHPAPIAWQRPPYTAWSDVGRPAAQAAGAKPGDFCYLVRPLLAGPQAARTGARKRREGLALGWVWFSLSHSEAFWCLRK